MYDATWSARSKLAGTYEAKARPLIQPFGRAAIILSSVRKFRGARDTFAGATRPLESFALDVLRQSSRYIIRVILISALAYGWLIFVLRVAGKRSLSKLNAFDLVVTVALGSTLATVLLTKDVAFLEGALAFCMLAGLQWLVSRLSVLSGRFSKLVRSQPKLLMENGVYRKDAMDEERVTTDEVDAAVRNAGLGRLEDVAAVVLETDGSMSVIHRTEGQLTALSSVGR